MEKVLVVSSLAKGTALLTSLLKEEEVALHYAASGGEARRHLLEDTFGLVVILAPLCDESGIDLAETAVRGTAGILLVVKSDWQEENARRLTDKGVFVYTFSMGRKLFSYAVQLLLTLHRRLETALPQKEKVEQRIEDIRIVNRAKCLLIQYTRLTEEEAHRFIEKQAMDRRLTKREIAEEILRQHDIV